MGSVTSSYIGGMSSIPVAVRTILEGSSAADAVNSLLTLFDGGAKTLSESRDDDLTRAKRAMAESPNMETTANLLKAQARAGVDTSYVGYVLSILADLKLLTGARVGRHTWMTYDTYLLKVATSSLATRHITISIKKYGATVAYKFELVHNRASITFAKNYLLGSGDENLAPEGGSLRHYQNGEVPFTNIRELLVAMKKDFKRVFKDLG